MKTAISLPDTLFEQVNRLAAASGMNRSQFFVWAVERVIVELDRNALTEEIDTALAAIGEDESGRDAVAAGRRRLAQEADDW